VSNDKVIKQSSIDKSIEIVYTYILITNTDIKVNLVLAFFLLGSAEESKYMTINREKKRNSKVK